MTGNPSQFPFEQHLHGGRADQPVLSEASINELLSLGGDAGLDLVVELVDLFLGDSVQRLTQAREGLESSQPEEVSRAAHALKSSSANMGAMAFSALCAEMEQKGRDGELEALTDSIQRMDEMYAELESALRALRETCVQ